MTQAIRARRLVRLPIARPLMLTAMLALAACSTISSITSSKDTLGTRASGATPGNLAPEQTAETILKVADDTRAGGDLGNAVGLYRRAHELAPRDPVPLARAGETLAQMQAYTEAADAYQAALSIAPGDAELQRGFANVLLALGKPQLALAHLEIAASKNSGDARIYNALGVAHDLAGRHDLAQQDYRRGLALAPDQLSLRNNLGLSQALSGDFKGGIATLSDLIARPGATARNRQNLALVYGLAGDTTHAASVGRSDLDEVAVRNNLAYFTLLRSLDDVGRTAAILGADVRAARAAAQPAGTVGDPAIAEAPAPARVAEKALPPAPPIGAFAPIAMKSPKRAVLQPEQDPDAAASTSLELAEPTPSAALEVPTARPASADVRAASVDEAGATQLASAAPVMSPPAAPKATKRRTEASSMDPQSEAALTPTPVSVPADPAPASSPHKAPAASDKRLVVQLGAFQVEANAHKLTAQLKAKGITDLVIVHDRDRQGRDWYIVRTETLASQEAAEAAARGIRDAGDAEARIIHISAAATD